MHRITAFFLCVVKLSEAGSKRGFQPHRNRLEGANPKQLSCKEKIRQEGGQV